MTEEALFDLALNTPLSQLAALLDRECTDPALRARVRALLAAHASPRAAVDAAPTGPTVDQPSEAAPETPTRPTVDHVPPVDVEGGMLAGKYKLIEHIGEGGMGSVWLAQQSAPVKRRVAVKLIKPGMDSRQVIARFEAERQALAMMDHPNIAKVLDGGLTADGRPFFVMELVKGVPITEYCDALKLTPQQRLELFIPVTQAIQHAHQKGIIHRDIKPSNVLIAMYDDRPVPKVIDFGVAKATGQQLSEHTINTGFGGVVGTPQYMSPEQATFNNLDIDTRSDVYSLGVLLYELLAGSPPFSRPELEKRGLLEILRVVREEEPPRPSTKLSSAETYPSLSASRGTEPKKLTGLLRNELDWIVMKALEKDRTRRYDTANAFAADVQRYLTGEAVLAHPPSAGYRLRKAYRKNRGSVMAGSAVAATLVAGLAGTTWQAIRASQEADRVRAEQSRTQVALAAAELNQKAAEGYLAKSFLRPLGYRVTFDDFDEPEVFALDEIAQLTDMQLRSSTASGDIRGDMVAEAAGTEDRLKLRCLTEALADPETAFRTARVADRFIQAVVGTSLERRKQAIDFVTAKQMDASVDVRVRLGACWFGMVLQANELPALREACAYLVTLDAGIDKMIAPIMRHRSTDEQLICVAEYLPQLWDKYSIPVYYGKSDIFAMWTSLDDLQRNRLASAILNRFDRLGRAVGVVHQVLAYRADRLPASALSRLTAVLTANIAETKDIPPQEHAEIISSLELVLRQVPRTDTQTSERAVRTIITALPTVRHSSASVPNLVKVLQEITPNVSEGCRRTIVTGLAAAADRAAECRQSGDETIFETALASIANIDPVRALQVAADGAARSQAVLARQPDRSARVEAWGCLTGAASRLPSGGQQAIGAAFLADPKLADGFPTFKRACSAVARGLPGMDAVTRRAVAERLTGWSDVRERGDYGRPTSSSPALDALSDIDPVAARKLVADMTGKGPSEAGGWLAVVRKLCDPAARADPATAADCARIIAALSTVAAADGNYDTSHKAWVVLKWIDPDRARKAWSILFDRACKEIAEKPVDGHRIKRLFEDADPELNPQEMRAAGEVCQQIVRKGSLSDSNSTGGITLLAIIPQLDGDTAARLADVWPNFLRNHFLESGDRRELLDVTFALARTLSPDAARRLRLAAAEKIGVMFSEKNSLELHLVLLDGLRQLDPARYADLRDAETRRAVRLLFDDHEPKRGAEPEPIPVLAAVNDWRFLAEFLSHPRCVEPLRQPLLERLEELLIHPRTTDRIAAAFALSPGGPLAIGLGEAAWQQSRQFRTQWDVAEYLAKHHPDFKLGRPPRPKERR